MTFGFPSRPPAGEDLRFNGPRAATQKRLLCEIPATQTNQVLARVWEL